MTRPSVKRNLAERFWPKVDRRGPDECWPWLGFKDSHGYGMLKVNYRRRLASRISLELDGRAPGALCALHKCDNPICVNPGHLYAGTLRDNTQDMLKRGRCRRLTYTHCKHGHPYDAENTIIRKNKGNAFRVCRTCETAAGKRCRMRKAAA